MRKGKGTNGDGVYVDTLYYRFRGIEVEGGELSVDGREEPPMRINDNDPLIEPQHMPVRPGKVTTKEVELELRLLKRFAGEEGGKNRPVSSLEFSLSCDNPKFRLTGPDVEVLRKAAWDHLDKEFAVKWTAYFLVSVRPATDYSGGISNGLTFGYESVWRGVAHDGTLLMKRYNRSARYEVLPWPGRFVTKDGNVQACIEGTDANRAALMSFIDKVTELRDRMSEFFKPETILQTLANMGNLRMLASSSKGLE